MSQARPNYYISSHLSAILLALAGLLSGAPAIAQTPPEDLPPDLVLAKDDGGVSAGPGDVVPYTLAWSNPSQGLGLLVVLTETVPEHSTFEPTASEAGWQCTPDGSAGSTCTLVIGTVPAGGSGSAVFAVRPVVPMPAGVTELVNTGFILDVDIQRQAEPDSNPDNNTATDTTPLVGFAPDLSVTKSDQGASVEPGGTAVYHLTYRNTGPRHAAGVVLNETVPEHTVFDPARSDSRWVCATSGGPGSPCTLAVGPLASGAAAEETLFAVTLAPTLPAGVTQVVNTATIADDGTAGPDLHPADNSATDTTPITGAAPELTVAKDLDPTSNPQPGGVLVWSLAYANTGNQGAAGVVLHETVPAHATYRPQGSDPRWTCTGSGPGAPCTLELGEVPAGDSGAVVFAVTVASSLPAGVDAIDNCAQLDTAESCHTVPLPEVTPDLSIAKSDQGASVEPGGTVVYRLTYRNVGGRDATGVVLTETVPEHTAFAPGASGAGWSCGGSGGAGSACTLAVGDLHGAGTSGETLFAVTLAAILPAGVTEIVNTVSIADDGVGGPDAHPADNSATETTPITGAAPELTVAKALDAASDPQPGGVLVWSLAYANTGNQGAAGVVLHETVPAHTAFRPQGSDPRWSCTGTGTGAPCTLDLGEVAAGDSGEVAFAVTVDTPLPAGVEVTENCAQLGTAESCHTAALDAAPDLALTKDDGGVTVRPGGVVIYTLTAVNHGNQDADGVAVTDRLPPSTVFSAEGSSPGWTCSVEPPGAPVCSIVLGATLAGGSRTVTLALTAGEATGGTVLTNTATVTDDGTGGADPNPDDNTASDTTPVEEPPPPPPPPTEAQLEVDLSDEPFNLDGDGLGAGDAVTYIVFVRNVGGAIAEEVVFVVEPDPHTGLLADSVTTSQGHVLEGQGPDDARVAVALGALEAGGSAEILFTVEIARILPPELTEIAVHGLAMAENAAEEPSDDPDTPEDDDPTRTPLTREPGQVPEEIPVLSGVGFGLFILLLAGGALLLLRHSRSLPEPEEGRRP